MDNFMVLEKNMVLTSPSRESFNRDSGRRDSSKTKSLSTMENSKITSFMVTALLSFKMEWGMKANSVKGKYTGKESLSLPTKYSEAKWKTVSAKMEDSSGFASLSRTNQVNYICTSMMKKRRPQASQYKLQLQGQKKSQLPDPSMIKLSRQVRIDWKLLLTEKTIFSK